jgi:multicomponent Na+:H+ antiporter subunit F
MSYAIGILVILFTVVIMIPFYRVWKGPTVYDRLLAIGAIGGKVLALILLMGLRYDRFSMFIDIALGYAVLNFIGGIAMAEYFRLKEKEE